MRDQFSQRGLSAIPQEYRQGAKPQRKQIRIQATVHCLPFTVHRHSSLANWRPDAASGMRAVRRMDDDLEHVAAGPSFGQACVAKALLEIFLVRFHVHELVEDAMLGPADD